MKGLSPTQRTLRALRERGLVCQVVERWNPFGGPLRPDGQGRVGRRNDLFGILDVLALDPQWGVIGIQSCGSDFMGHFRKLTQEMAQEMREWQNTTVICPHCGEMVQATRLEIWSWRKVKKVRGGKGMIWEPRVYVFPKNGG